MSVALLAHEQLNLMVWAGSRANSHEGNLYLGTLGEQVGAGLYQRSENNESIGRKLAQTLAMSYDDRYSESTSDAFSWFSSYQYKAPARRTWSAPEVLMAIRSYEYQACEAEGWNDADNFARLYCQILFRHVANTLVDLSNADTWFMDAETVPAYENPAEQTGFAFPPMNH